MEELVKKTEAVKALRKCQTYLYDARDRALKIELESAERAIRDLPAAERKTEQWIPTGERLPREFENVWVTDNLGNVAVCYMAYDAWRDRKTDFWIYRLDEVIAWMPYIPPKPYRDPALD